MNGTITLVSNKDGGQSRKVKIAAGMTLAEVFHSELGCEVDPKKFGIMVNGKTVERPKSCDVKDGDFVVIVPSQIKGNRLKQDYLFGNCLGAILKIGESTKLFFSLPL